MHARSITLLATLIGAALAQTACNSDDASNALSTEPEIISQTISNATP